MPERWTIEEGMYGDDEVWAVRDEKKIAALCPTPNAARRVASALNQQRDVREMLEEITGE